MLFQLALFVLGVMGSLWTTIYALFDYHSERMGEFDVLVHRVLFDEVFPHHCLPIILGRLRQWDGGEGGGRPAFVALHMLCLLSAQEYDTYISLAVESLCQPSLRRAPAAEACQCRRLWFSRKYITRRVRDVAPQYPWHVPLLAHLGPYLAEAAT